MIGGLSCVMVAVEHDVDGIAPVSLAAISMARSFAAGESSRIVAVAVVGLSAALQDEVFAHGATEIVHTSMSDECDLYAPDLWVSTFARIAAECSPELILMPATPIGSEAAARLAYRLEAPFATGCDAVRLVDRELVARRACLGGRFVEDIRLPLERTVLTIRSGAFEALRLRSDRGPVARLEPDLGGIAVRARLLDRSGGGAIRGTRLDSARVVVSGGRGLGGAEGFVRLEELADALGAALGGSRVACELGWCPADRQIGLSGHTVSPEVYWAFGISGASHHMAGCAKSRTVVAVNNDPEADIFKYADFGVVADAGRFTDALLRAIRTS